MSYIGVSESDKEEACCDGCGTTCLDHTSNKGRGSESPCPTCDETRCKHCPCECADEGDVPEDVPENDICCGCGHTRFDGLGDWFLDQSKKVVFCPPSAIDPGAKYKW